MKKRILITIITILVGLTGLFGLLRRSQNPYVKEKPLTKINSNENQSFEHFINEAKNTKLEASKNIETSFLAVGDISLSRNIANTITKTNNPNIPFEKIADVLKSVDFTFANLESPFSESNSYTPKDTLVFNAPKNNIEGFVRNNINVLNLANNHAFDQKLSGIKTTKNWLAEKNFEFMGTGENLDEAWKPAYKRSKGLVIAFIGASYASINDGGKTSNDFVARMEDTDHLKYAIREAKSRADFIVVTMHGGAEYTRTPNSGQTDFARKAIDFGADIVIGAHPHWIQTIEKYQNKYIFYSLGNFIFDQNWSQETKEGLALKISLEKPQASTLQGSKIPAAIKQIELIPIIIDSNCCPRQANEIETKNILKKIDREERIIK